MSDKLVELHNDHVWLRSPWNSTEYWALTIAEAELITTQLSEALTGVAT
jgi:hypothetical protein